MCCLASRSVRNMHHLICVHASRECKFRFLGKKTFFLFQLYLYLHIYKLDDFPIVAFHVKRHLTSALKTEFQESGSAIGDLYDGAISPQLPESFTFSVSCANQDNCYLNPTGNSKFK